jgi:hypothetical protein
MMQILVAVAQLSILALAAVIFLGLLVAYCVGFSLATRRAQHPPPEAEGIGQVVTGMLGLLAFSLGLSLSMAQSRFDVRRAAALQEANAIGTAWLRAHAIGHERGAIIARLLEDYTRLRIEYVRAGPEQPGLAAISQRTGDMQGVIWGHATAIVRERPDPAVAALLESLNGAFDSSTAQRWAFVDPIPEEIVSLLLAMSVLAIGAMSYQIALRRRRHPVAACMLIAMWAATITVIVDLSQPRIGSVRVDTRVYEWTLRGFSGGVAIPPML